MQTAQPVYSVFGNDRDLSDMVADFVDHLPTRVEHLRAYSEARDVAGLKSEAHRLKGAGGCYGFEELFEQSGKLEAACEVNSPESEIGAAVQELLKLCARVRAGTPD